MRLRETWRWDWHIILDILGLKLSPKHPKSILHVCDSDIGSWTLNVHNPKCLDQGSKQLRYIMMRCAPIGQGARLLMLFWKWEVTNNQGFFWIKQGMGGGQKSNTFCENSMLIFHWKVTTEAQLGLIGGTMGLLTGFSILSGVEIIYYLLRYILPNDQCKNINFGV